MFSLYGDLPPPSSSGGATSTSGAATTTASPPPFPSPSPTTKSFIISRPSTVTNTTSTSSNNNSSVTSTTPTSAVTAAQSRAWSAIGNKSSAPPPVPRALVQALRAKQGTPTTAPPRVLPTAPHKPSSASTSTPTPTSTSRTIESHSPESDNHVTTPTSSTSLPFFLSNHESSNPLSRTRSRSPSPAKEAPPIDEYNPARPNDYEQFVMDRERRRAAEQRAKAQKEAERQARKDAEKREREEQERAERERSKGAIAPPPMLQTTTTPKVDLNISGEEAFARRARMSMGAGAPPPTQSPAQDSSKRQKIDPTSSASNYSNPSRIVLLRNMVGRGDTDGVAEETAEECTKYGKVLRCKVFDVPGNVPDSEAVRIFVVFQDPTAAKSAITDLNGRFFGGRAVQASYYPEASFTEQNFMA